MNPFDDTVLIHKIYVESDETLDDFKDNWIDSNEIEAGDFIPEFEDWGYGAEPFSLQDILDKVPQGTDLKNILIVIKCERQISYMEVQAICRKPTDKEAWEAGRDKEEADYKRRLAIYEKEKAKYDEWKIKQDIKDLEKKLAKLKK